ncbi:MAG: ATP-binding protein [Actinomycetota bacterium]|nr:ATP-binding protein [Actinomycetota bacterium]
MDPRRNPYTPNAGARPPALVGRDEQLEAFDILLHRLELGRPQQSMIVTGLRGVGKTVLLGAFRDKAMERRWLTVEAEVSKNSDFADRMSRHVRRALLGISPAEKWKERARSAAEALKSFSLTFSPDGSVATGFTAQASPGRADSGDLAKDLTDLFVALGEAAREGDTGIVFLFDEVQYFSVQEFEALIAALHKTVQRALPITLVAAGLPQIPKLAGEAKSYSERLFTFPVIGKLGQEDAAAALVLPAEEEGAAFESAAVAAIVDYTGGYPYFIQEFGKIIWDQATDSAITVEDALNATPLVEDKLDESFFRVRAERTTPLELQYMRAMAELGPGAQKAGEVADLLGRTSEQLGPTRSSLIEKGLLYTPSHGYAAFTVPQFDRYMKRNHPLDPPPVRRR